MVLDIKHGEDAGLLREIIASADVFIQNLAPGAASRAGFDSAELRACYPRLITCDISGYGEEGEYAKRKAYDLLVQAETGLSMITGSEHAPGRVGVSVCDIAAGMHAWGGILQALYEREITGSGQGVKVSLFDGMADWMTVPLLHQRYGGAAPKRVGLNHPSIAPYGAYTIGDGSRIVISIQNQREWINFCDTVLLQAPLATQQDFVNNDARVRNRIALDQVIGGVLGALHQKEVVDRLQQAQVAFGMLNTVKDLSEHPQLRTCSVQTPAGTVDLVASAIRRSAGSDNEEAQAPFNPVPEIGEHSDSIRAEFQKD